MVSLALLFFKIVLTIWDLLWFHTDFRIVFSSSVKYSMGILIGIYLPAMRETWVWSLGREDPLEKEMAAHSSTFAWKIPWTEEPGRLQSMGSQRFRHDWATSLHFTFSFQRNSTWGNCFSGQGNLVNQVKEKIPAMVFSADLPLWVHLPPFFFLGYSMGHAGS